MRTLLDTHDVLGQATAIAAIALILAFSLCALDRDGDGADDQGIDICAMPIATATSVILLVAPAVTGWFVTEMLYSASEATPHLPDPPPKSTALV